MKSIDIKKIFSRITNIKRLEFKSVSSKARFDWKVMIIIFFFIWIGVIVYSTTIFFDIDKGTFFTSEVVQNQQTSIINKKTLDTVITMFEEKSKKLEELKTNTVSIPDPSE